MVGDTFDLSDLGMLDARRERSFETLVDVVMHAMGVPVVLISVIDDAGSRQVFKAQRGLAEPYASASETSLETSVCRSVRDNDGPLEISDMVADPDFSDHPAIESLRVRAYLGFPIRGPANEAIGAFCVIDHAPRTWTQRERSLLAGLAELATQQVLLRATMQTIRIIRTEMTAPTNRRLC